MVRYDWENVLNENVVDLKQRGSYKLAFPLLLGDGTMLSIQASGTHYSEPKEILKDYNDYKEFEIGFPSDEIKELLRYAEDVSNPTKTVYAYVPKHIINRVIEKHGGVVCSISFEQLKA